MATLTLTSSPFLQTSAQLLILPVSNDGRVFDPTINRCKNLFRDNYRQYREACIEGTLSVGDCLLVRHKREQIGLSTGSRGGQPDFIINLAINDHATHGIRAHALEAALNNLYPILYELMRYKGLRRVALLARPLILPEPLLDSPALSWQDTILPAMTDKLEALPKVRIDIHIPKDMMGEDGLPDNSGPSR